MRRYRPFDPVAGELSGTQVVEASAGTGKTYNLTFLLLRLVLERELEVARILVVTFTKLATAELRDAVRARLRQAAAVLDGQAIDDVQVVEYLKRFEGAELERARRLLRRALGDFDQAAIFSIHGFCQRMLGHNAFESGVPFEQELIEDLQPLCLELASDFYARRVYAAPEPFVDYLAGTAGLDRAALAELVRKAADKPDAHYLFGDCADEQVEPALEAAFERAREIWVADRSTLYELIGGLADREVLKKEYKGAKLVKLFEGLDRLLGPPTIRTVTRDGGLPKLTPRGLVAGVFAKQRAGFELPRQRFFDAAAELAERMAAAREVYRRRANLLQRELVEYTWTELERRKRERGIQSFNDQLHDLDRALSDAEAGPRLFAEVRRQFAAALIDEFQDTNPVQYRIFSRLFDDGETPFFTIGDPKQAIYAFRGGDVFAYLEAVRRTGADPLTLEVNWRADHRLIKGVNALFGRVEDPFVSEEIGFPAVVPRPLAEGVDVLVIDGESPPPLQLLLEDREDDPEATVGDEHARVAADIRALLDAEAYVARPEDEGRRRRITAGDIAVLLTGNYQAPLLQAALREQGVASVVISDQSVFQTTEAIELERLLAAVSAPGDGALVRAALATDLIGLGAAAIRAMADDDRAWEDWIVLLKEWRAIWEERGILQLLRAVMAWRVGPGGQPNQARILGTRDGERRMTNLGHLGELLHRRASDGHLGCAGLLRWLALRRAGGGDTAESAELRLESDDQAVKLLTIHKAKGLQFPVVYLPYMRRGKVFAAADDMIEFHDPDAGLRPTIDLGSDQLEEHRAILAREELAERLRVLYVGLTRAQHLCRVVWSWFDGYENSALGYLLHRPAEACSIAAAKERIEALEAEEWLADLARVAELADGGILIDRLARAGSPGGPERATPPPVELEHRRLRRGIRRRWFGSSYSDLTRTPERPPRMFDDEADRDQVEAEGEDLPATETEEVDFGGADQPVALRGFDAGKQPGKFFHKVYEELDFTAGDRPGLEQFVNERLRTYGLDDERWTPVVSAAIDQTLNAVIDPSTGLRLRDLTPGQRLNELRFVLPAAGGAEGGGRRVTPASLAAAFAAHGREQTARYAARLEALEFGALRGYLTGVIDLVCEHRGKWYVVDYKSNLLGPQARDYAAARLWEPMAAHHYILQYHLYVLALHRYLGYRLPGYEFDEHFGGVFYLFLRGLTERTGSACGVFADRPGGELIEALSRLFDGSDRTEGGVT